MLRFTMAGLVLSALALVGCNSHGNRGSVTGKVTLDGQPLEKGRLSFEPIEGTQSPSAGSPIENGSYSIPIDKGPMAGTYRVEIHATRPTGKKIAGKSPLPPGTMIDETVSAIPPAFTGSTSKLRVEITAGSNTKNFEVLSK